MKFYKEKDIKNVWNQKVKEIKNNNTNQTFNVYIDNPFCINQCIYCIHQGEYLGCYNKDFKRYYKEYLPKQIKKFSYLFKIKKPDTLYFGGGSPNAMSAKIMKNIFGQIPDFKDIPNKVFEANPNLMNNKKLKLLNNNNFSYISYGVQSLKDEVLEHNNRKKVDIDYLNEVINKIQASGTKVNCDIMAFIGKTNYRHDIERIKEDIVDLYTTVGPDIITVYPERSVLRKERNSNGFELISKLRNMLKEVAGKYSLTPSTNVDNDDPSEEYYYNYRLSTMSLEETREVRQYTSSGPPNQPHSQNVLGLGGYKEHTPYSYHGKDFAYLTTNNNWEPKYTPIRQGGQN